MLAISSLLTIVQALLVLFYVPQLAEETILFVVAPAICLLSLALVLGFVLGFYGLRRKPARQTNYYQPIKLRAAMHQWLADITGMELALSNHD